MSDVLRMFIDIGSALIKAFRADDAANPVVFSNTVAKVTDFALLQEQQAMSMTPIEAFEFDGETYVVGDAALAFPGHLDLSGTERYRQENEWYYRALFAYALHLLFPKCNRDTVEVTFSVSLESFTEFSAQVGYMLEGDFAMRTYGSKAGERWTKVHVRAIPERGELFGALPETFGALVHEATTVKGKPSKLMQDLHDGHVLVIDFGGRTLDFLPLHGFRRDGVTESHNAGIIDVRRSLSSLLRKRLEGGFDHNFTNAALDAVLAPDQDGEHTIVWNGSPIQVTGEANKALGLLWDEFYRIWRTTYRSGRPFTHVLFTGGASKALEPFFTQHITHSNLWVVRKAQPHLANLYGMGQFRLFQADRGH